MRQDLPSREKAKEREREQPSHRGRGELLNLRSNQRRKLKMALKSEAGMTKVVRGNLSHWTGSYFRHSAELKVLAELMLTMGRRNKPHQLLKHSELTATTENSVEAP